MYLLSGFQWRHLETGSFIFQHCEFYFPSAQCLSVYVGLCVLGLVLNYSIILCVQTQDPECLFSFHAGVIQGMDVSSTSHLMATTTLDRESGLSLYTTTHTAQILETHHFCVDLFQTHTLSSSLSQAQSGFLTSLQRKN